MADEEDVSSQGISVASAASPDATAFKITNAEWVNLLDGSYELALYTTYTGGEVVPRFKVWVKTESDYLLLGQSGAPQISVDPPPATGSVSYDDDSMTLTDIKPSDFTVTVIFKAKPPVNPDIEISP